MAEVAETIRPPESKPLTRLNLKMLKTHPYVSPAVRGLTAVLISGTALLFAGSAEAYHFDRGHFVPAFTPCEEGSANTATTNGIPACSPPVLLSNCAANPQTALNLGGTLAQDEKARSSYLLRAKGRRRTRHNEELRPDLESRIQLYGVRDCTGALYDGDVQVRMKLRIVRDDPTCTTGQCTLPDITHFISMPCDRGRCKVLGSLNNELAALGKPLLPLGQPYIMRVVEFDILDQAGSRFLTMGMQSSEGFRYANTITDETPWLSRLMKRMAHPLAPDSAFAYGASGTGGAGRAESRYIRAFHECDPDLTDTLTTDGQEACSSVPFSNCVDNPVSAVLPFVPPEGDHNTDGKAKIALSVKGENLAIRGRIHGMEDCRGVLYNGIVSQEATIRATVRDPSCALGICTTVDTVMFSSPSVLRNGEAFVKPNAKIPIEDLDVLPGASSQLNAEILSVQFQDPKGFPFLVGPGLLVRCNANRTPGDVGDGGFCFGN